MDNKCRQKHSKTQNSCSCSSCEEVSSMEWEVIKMSEEEEDIIRRMHKLVGDKWGLIAGRIPGRKAEEIERFWLMRNKSESFKSNRMRIISIPLQQQQQQHNS
ncbi:MYB-like transcription factor ETC3 [Sesamum indicum]|uniref:MYB-like transcription factor ETC3 n=1 Tax=Sesamum indicum TaxID=4182 RepID=A0A6I9U3P1_SESIN|nr:MYB-like transcription factor ETC3 [Sesamum indicum]